MTHEPPHPIAADLALALAFLAWCVAVVADPYRLSHDSAILLDVAGKLLNGHTLYNEIGVTNPPLAYYVNILPQLCAKGLGGSPVRWLQVWMIGLTALSVSWLRFRLSDWLGRINATLLGLAVIGWSFQLHWRDDFAQRPQVFVLLAIPYVVTRLRRMDGREHVALATLAGVLGAAGVCLKPHYLAVFAAFELVMLWNLRRRWLGPGVIAMAIAGLAYGVHLATLPSDMRHALFEMWLPALREGYHIYGSSERLVTARVAKLSWTVVVPLAMAFVFLDGTRRRAALALVAAAAAGVWIFALQDKGWTYQMIPALGFTWLAVAMSLGAIVDVFPRASLLTVVFAAWVGWPAVDLVRNDTAKSPNRITEIVLEHTQVGDKVLVVSSNAYQAYPGMIIEQRAITSSFPMAWPVPVLYSEGLPGGRYRSSATRSQAESVFAARVVRDLQHRPDVVIVETRRTCSHCAEGVSIVGFLRHIRFMDELRRGWTVVGRAQNCEVWVRKSRKR